MGYKMNKEKEIKDICKLICATCAQFDGCAINCKAHRDTAEALYNAGYRKTLSNTELFTQNMKNVLEIEKKQAVKEFAEKLKANEDLMITNAFDLSELIDTTLKEYENGKSL